MLTPSGNPNPLLEAILDFLVSSPTQEQIIAFTPPEPLQAHVRGLLERNRQGMLTREEQRELSELTYLNHLMSMLKIRARKKLAGT